MRDDLIIKGQAGTLRLGNAGAQHRDERQSNSLDLQAEIRQGVQADEKCCPGRNPGHRYIPVTRGCSFYTA